MTDYSKFKNMDTGPVLLRQDEPGTPQYIAVKHFRLASLNFRESVI